NAGRDRTAGVACAHGARILSTPVRGVSHARNLGARASGGEVLVFLDADTALAPGALDAIAAAVPARADYGTCRIRPDRTTLPAVLTATVLPWGHRLAGTSPGILFCTRVLFERAGGCDERLHAGAAPGPRLTRASYLRRPPAAARARGGCGGTLQLRVARGPRTGRRGDAPSRLPAARTHENNQRRSAASSSIIRCMMPSTWR